MSARTATTQRRVFGSPSLETAQMCPFIQPFPTNRQRKVCRDLGCGVSARFWVDESGGAGQSHPGGRGHPVRAAAFHHAAPAAATWQQAGYLGGNYFPASLIARRHPRHRMQLPVAFSAIPAALSGQFV